MTIADDINDIAEMTNDNREVLSMIFKEMVKIRELLSQKTQKEKVNG